MIDLEFVERLIRAVDDSGIDSIEIERGGTRIRVAKTPPVEAGGRDAVAAGPAPARPGAAPAGANDAGPGGSPATAARPLAEAEKEAGVAAEEEEASDLVEVTSPMVGTFYRAPAPDAPPYVEVGDRVARGDTLCIIEAMKLMNELECETAGRIAEICVENADPVEYGQLLFRIEPA